MTAEWKEPTAEYLATSELAGELDCGVQVFQSDQTKKKVFIDEDGEPVVAKLVIYYGAERTAEERARLAEWLAKKFNEVQDGGTRTYADVFTSRLMDGSDK